MGIIKRKTPTTVTRIIPHKKERPSMKKLLIKPKQSMKRLIKKTETKQVGTTNNVVIPIVNMNYDPEVLRKANCCVTVSDIDDDSQKTTTKVQNRPVLNTLFVICRDSLLLQDSLDCPNQPFINTFREFVNEQFEVYKNLNMNSLNPGEKNICCIPFTNLPIRVNVGSVFNNIMYFIPDDPTGRRLKSFIKDNSSAPEALRVIQKFSIASFLDESGKSIITGSLTLHAFLNRLYGENWSLNLYDKGLTTNPGVIAVYWGIQQNISYFIQYNYNRSDPSTKTNLINVDTPLLPNQLLVILKIRNSRFGVIFQFTHSQTVNQDGTYINIYTTPCTLKIPVFYDIEGGTIRPSPNDIQAFFAAFFNGNPPKNNWFNIYNGRLTQDLLFLYTILGEAILVSKGLCDALFSFTITKETGIATNDLTTAIRALIHFLSVIYRIYDIRAGSNKGNIYLVIEPDAVEKPIHIDTANLRKRFMVKIKKVILQIGSTVITMIEYISKPVRRSLQFLTPRAGGEGEGIEKSDEKPLPESDEKPLPESDEKPLPESDEEPLPKTIEETAGANDKKPLSGEEPLPESDKEILLLANNLYIYVQEIFKMILFPNIEIYIKFLEILESKIIVNDLDDENEKKIRIKKLCINTILTFLRELISKKKEVSSLAKTFVNNISNKIGYVPSNDIVLEFICIFDYDFDNTLPTFNVVQKNYDLYEILNSYDSKLFSDDIFDALLKESTNLYTVYVSPNTPSITDLLTESQGTTSPGIVNIIEQLRKFKVKDENDKKEFNELVSKIEFLITKSPIKEKYKIVQELSVLLDDISKFISLNELLYILVSCFTSNELIAKCITKELISITSMRGVSIFDIQIIEAFVDGIDIDPKYESISYPKDYNGINTLINIKKYIGDEVLDFLTDNGLSLKQIGDFVHDIIDEIESDNLDNEDKIDLFVTESVMKQLEPLKKKLEQQKQMRIDPMGLALLTQKETQNQQLVEPVSGGNNKPNPKHKAKYRKKYKKFVSKYIINKNKNKSTHGTKNKTKKNKRLTKPKHGSNSKSKYAKKTLKNKNKNKNKKRNHKSNHKSKHNKKANTNYYNLYKHNKTLKH